MVHFTLKEKEIVFLNNYNNFQCENLHLFSYLFLSSGFLFTFYFYIIIGSQEVAKQYKSPTYTLPNFPQWYILSINSTISKSGNCHEYNPRPYSDFISFTRICMCVYESFMLLLYSHTSSLSFSLSLVPGNYQDFLHFFDFLFQKCYLNGIVQYETFDIVFFHLALVP